jgi:hypothetical protein
LNPEADSTGGTAAEIPPGAAGRIGVDSRVTTGVESTRWYAAIAYTCPSVLGGATGIGDGCRIAAGAITDVAPSNLGLEIGNTDGPKSRGQKKQSKIPRGEPGYEMCLKKPFHFSYLKNFLSLNNYIILQFLYPFAKTV